MIGIILILVPKCSPSCDAHFDLLVVTITLVIYDILMSKYNTWNDSGWQTIEHFYDLFA